MAWLELDGSNWGWIQTILHFAGAGLGFVLAAALAVLCGVAAVGSLKRQNWAFWLGTLLLVPLLCTGNLLPVLILLFLLSYPEIRAHFTAKTPQENPTPAGSATRSPAPN